MSEHKYTSLRDLLNDSQPPTATDSDDDDDDEDQIPLVTEYFGELYFRETSSSSIPAHLFMPPLPPRKVSVPPINQSGGGQGQGNQNPNDGPKNDDSKNKMAATHVKKNDSCVYNNSSKLFPVPISTLRMAKTGEPFTYRRFDEATSAFVEEKIMLPPKGEGVMAASREDGRLKMKFAHGQEDQEGDEGEASETVP